MTDISHMGRLIGVQTNSPSWLSLIKEFNSTDPIEAITLAMNDPLPDGLDSSNTEIIYGHPTDFICILVGIIIEKRIANSYEGEFRQAIEYYLKLRKLDISIMVLDDDGFIRLPDELNPKQLAIQYNLSHPNEPQAHIPTSDRIVLKTLSLVWAIIYLETQIKDNSDKTLNLFRTILNLSNHQIMADNYIKVNQLNKYLRS